jgi:shikimate dehydrogenase
MQTNSPNYKAELVGVFGYPVAENPTGVMQEAGFAALGLNWRYLTMEVRREDLAAAMQGLRAMNFRGINLTIPHKVQVLQYLDEVSPDARVMGAVNTVRRDGDRLIGENTDGKGFLRALREDAKVDPHGRQVVVLGAGGAARAVCVELALAGAQSIRIVNRSAARGEELALLLNEHTPVQAAYVPWMSGMRLAPDTDLLVNCTSIGLYPDVDGIPDIDLAVMGPHMVVCDVIPNPPDTPFLRAARSRGAKTIDGLGMLVYQGAIAFKMWTGDDAPVDVMRRVLAAEFGV